VESLKSINTNPLEIEIGMTSTPPQQNWTHPRLDDFHQLDDLRISTYAGRRTLNPPYANCPTSFPVNPTLRIQQSGNSWLENTWRTDIESDLRGINRLGQRVRCESAMYNPEKNTFNNTPIVSAPDANFPTEFNRLTNPPCTLRATGVNYFEPLIHNPQETFEQPFDFFIPNRQLDKEKYKSTPRRPTPLASVGRPLDSFSTELTGPVN